MTPRPGTQGPQDDGPPSAQERLPEDEARVRDLLRGVADVGPMPDDVVARLDAALAAAGRTPAGAGASPAGASPVGASPAVASLDARRRARVRRLQRVFATAAGIAVLAVGGTALVKADPVGGAGGASSSDGAASAAVAADLPATAQLLRSGKDFSNVAAVVDVAEDVVGDAPATDREAAPDDSGEAGGGPNLLAAPADPAPEDPASEDLATPAEDQRAVAERVVACAGVDPASVVAVEIATAGSEPAALVVHRTSEGAEGLVVALDCTAGSGVLNRVEVPAP